jgi:hypothetical protein
LALDLDAGNNLGGQPSAHTFHTVTRSDDHFYILNFGLPKLLAACPLLEVTLHITGSNPFLDCDFWLTQVRKPKSVVICAITCMFQLFQKRSHADGACRAP